MENGPGDSGAMNDQRTPRGAVWTVALRPEFGPPTGLARRLGVLFFGTVFLAPIAVIVVSAATGSSNAGGALVPGMIAFASVVAAYIVLHAAYHARAWRRLSTPAGVAASTRRGRSAGADDDAHRRACGAVRAAWPVFRRPRWERLRHIARAFDLAPPRAVLIDPKARFREYPREVDATMREPEDVGSAPTGAGLRSRAMSTMLLFAGLWIASELIGRWATGRPLMNPRTISAVAFICAVWAWDVFRPARRRWLFSSDAVLAAPSIVVVRSPWETLVFRASDSVLVLRRVEGVGDTRATLTRDDGRRVALRFAGPADERLWTLWTMWLHPCACRWDEPTESIVPE